MYPTYDHKYYGIFVKEQIDGLKRFRIQSNIYFINALENGKFEYVRSIVRLWKMIRKINPDVIHIHYGLSGLFLLFFRPKCKIFLTLHGGDILSKQGKLIQIFLTKRILKRVDKVFALNDEMESILTKKNINFEILPCGVDVNFFHPKNRQKNNEFKTLLFPGDPNRMVKNYKLFQEFIGVLQKDFHGDIKVVIIHNMDREEVVQALSNGDCLVMTSISEGSPQIVKEALFCNLPVVSVPVGDVRNVLKDLPGCYVTKSHSAKELSEAVVKSFNTNSLNLRELFCLKGTYDNDSITRRIYNNYVDI